MAFDIAGLLGSGVSAIANLFGGDANARNARQIAEQNIWNQQQFAKNAIQWKVQDAKEAGIHPLFALGASTQGFNNVVGDTSLGDSIGRAGQDIGRAISATGDTESRALTIKSAQLDIEKKGLENDILRMELNSKLRLATQPGQPPAYPDPFNTGTKPLNPNLTNIKLEPAKLTPGASDMPHVMPTANPAVQLYRSASGWTPAPSPELAEAIEDNMFLQFMWSLNNVAGPMVFGSGGVRPVTPSPSPAHRWGMQWNGDYDWIETTAPLKMDTAKLERYYQAFKKFLKGR